MLKGVYLMYSAYLKKSHTVYPGGETTKLTSRRKLKIGRLCLSVFVAIAITTIGFYHFVLQSDLFLLKEISVIGNNRTPQNKIIKESGLVIGVDNIYSLPLRELEKKLEDKFSYIKNSTLTKKMPGLITIKVVEREPVALIVHENAIYPPHIRKGETGKAKVEDLAPLPSDLGELNFLVDIEGFVLEIIEDVESFYKERVKVKKISQLPVQGNSVSLDFRLNQAENPHLSLMNPPKSEKMRSEANALGSFKNIILVTYGGKQSNSILEFRPGPQAGTGEPLASAPQVKRQLNSPPVQLALSVIKHIQEAACELLSEVTSINANNPQKITLSLKDGSIAFLEAGYLLAGLENVKTVLMYRKNRREIGGYIDARFSGIVYCRGATQKAREPESQKASKK